MKYVSSLCYYQLTLDRCRCTVEFCYECGTTSQRCKSCGDYDEPRITERAHRALEIRVARRIEQCQAVDDRPPVVLMREVQQVLRVDCDHNNLFYEPLTPSEPEKHLVCDWCHGIKYIAHCEYCDFTACRWCHSHFG